MAITFAAIGTGIHLSTLVASVTVTALPITAMSNHCAQSLVLVLPYPRRDRI